MSAVRKVFAAAGIRCESVELSDRENLCVDFGEPGQHPAGTASMWPEGDSLALEIRAWARAGEAAAPSVGLALLRLGLRSLEILGSWDGKPGAHVLPGEIVDAEFEIGPLERGVTANTPDELAAHFGVRRMEAAPAEFTREDAAETLAMWEPPAGAAADLERLATARADKLVAIAEALLGEPAADANVDDIPAERFVEGLERLRGALQGAREGRDAAWSALSDLARRTGVTLDGTESAGEVADLIHDFTAEEKKGLRSLADDRAAKLRMRQEEIDGLRKRLTEVSRALGLDEDADDGAVMERLEAAYEIAEAVRTELGFADFDGLGDAVVASFDSARSLRERYDELAAAIGCGANPAHDTAVRKAEQLQVKADRHDTLVRELVVADRPHLAFNAVQILKSEAVSFTFLQKLRMALFLSANASPAEIVDAALSRIEASGAATRKAEELLADLSKMKARLSAAVSSFEEVGRQLRSLDVPARAE